ncbi:hypothetical protein NO2_1734, partial [Candidatus Termititenax persephonae]
MTLGYVVGKGGNDFDPQGNYTRAEAMTLIDRATSEIIDESVSGQTYAKTLIVRKAGATIAGATIRGDLIIGQGVGGGDVVLDNVTIEGRLIAFGGGSNSIVVKGGSKIAAVVAGKPNVHIQMEGGVTV